MSSYRGNIYLIRKALSYGSIIYSTNDNGLNVMHMAAINNQPNSIVFFNSINFSLNSTDNYGNTPLHLAAKFGKFDAM